MMDSDVFLCTVCEVKVPSEKRFAIQQHIKRDKNIRGLENAATRKLSQLLTQTTATSHTPLRRQVVQIFSSRCSLPPKLIITRWGIWIDASVYYCNNFQVVKSVVATLESRVAKAILQAQELFSDSEMEGELAYLKSNFGFLLSTTAKLQESGVKLVTSIGLVKETEAAVGNIWGEISEK
ncbi:hypothetical protein ANN_07681 [Periplaneta americana]|uniref:Uncharacterized protein n=1 Tax=Periplaneta americana TaxID=6978 RepID=A0ABQ8SZ95_PERAM|nr:hypothetical protein ANN_07681 [Periplaneta americana]